MTQKVLLTGDFACFTRPELSVERVSYDVPTPSACKGVLEAIYRKPEMSWQIVSIQVLKPIAWTSIQRNEIKDLASVRRAGINIVESRIQRHTMLLRDVAYVIEGHIEALDGNSGKHVDNFRRRLERGQCWKQPCLGCREFPASFEPAPNVPEPDPALAGERDLGIMLHSLDYSTDPPGRRWYRPVMRDGFIRVPAIDSSEVLS